MTPPTAALTRPATSAPTDCWLPRRARPEAERRKAMVPMTRATTASSAAALATTRSVVTVPGATVDDAITSWTGMVDSSVRDGWMPSILSAGVGAHIVPAWTIPTAMGDGPGRGRCGRPAANYRVRSSRLRTAGWTHETGYPARVPA